MAADNLQDIILKPENPPVFFAPEKVFNRATSFDLEVDLGCGKGRFLLARSFSRPESSFLGIDRRRARIGKVGRAVRRAGVRNIRLLCSEIFFAVENLIPAESVSVYYLFFPDPWPKRRHHRRRLFDAGFRDAVRKTLKAGGEIHIATDHPDYFLIIKNLLAADVRFVEIAPFAPTAGERTNFELLFMGQNKPIARCSFMKSGPGF
ncbi:MAG: tRNA (guanosine(46)-N7)-methyltransferase TrmB [Kiritimatiellae bacterium]|nr:tRNA (guanosine(46)-N7)-methyltransferase TrmB [Kiritimatiellia bacterium]